MYVTIDEFGRFDVHEGKHGGIKGLQEWVGGYVEHLDGPHGLDVWIDEEGKLKDKRINWKVTEWMEGRLMPGDVIVGKVVITAMNEKRLAQFRDEFDDGITMVAI